MHAQYVKRVVESKSILDLVNLDSFFLDALESESLLFTLNLGFQGVEVAGVVKFYISVVGIRVANDSFDFTTLVGN